VEARRHGFEVCAEGLEVEVVEYPLDPHEEQAGLVILVLVGVDDIGAKPVEQSGNAGDQAFAIGTVDQ